MELNEKRQLSHEYERICYSMIKDFQTEMHREGYKDNLYSFHYPSFGNKFQSGKKILICNRWNDAKWAPTFTISESITLDTVEEGKIFSNSETSESLGNPIKRYFEETKQLRPFFYDVIKGTTIGLLGLNSDTAAWTDYIIFSSLLKIGKEAGPDQYEYQAQIEFSKLLFLLELEEIKPDIVLLITSLEYGEDFSSSLGLEPNESEEKSDFIIVKGDYKGAKVILARCPDVGDAAKCVLEVLDHLS
jgi:hypothetical protein